MSFVVLGKCHVQLPQHTRSETCLKKRKVDLARAQTFYVLTDETQQQTINFPLTFIPVVNQTMNKLQFYYAVDPDESRILMLLSTWTRAMAQIHAKIFAAFKQAPFTTYREYVSVYYAFLKAIKVSFNKRYKYSEIYEKAIKKMLISKISHFQLRSFFLNIPQFESLLEKDKSVTIHHRNIHVLATEMYKAKNSLSRPIIKNIFPINDGSYSLRNTNYFKLPRPNTVHNGLESEKYLGPKIWSM